MTSRPNISARYASHPYHNDSIVFHFPCSTPFRLAYRPLLRFPSHPDLTSPSPHISRDVQANKRGNLIKGYTGFLSRSQTALHRATCDLENDRIFSQSSSTSWTTSTQTKL